MNRISRSACAALAAVTWCVAAGAAPTRVALDPAAITPLPAAPAHQEGPVTAEARDLAIKRGFEYVDRLLWQMQDGGSPQKQYSAAILAWASLLASDKEGGAAKLPSRTKELDRIRSYLVNYLATVAKEYRNADEKDARRKSSKEPTPSEETMDDFASFMKPSQYVWPVGMAAHAFAESLARGRDKTEAKQALKDAVKVLEASQQPNGGWGHDDATRPGMGLPAIKIPKPGGGEFDYPGTLLAAANCALSGLGVAHAKLGTKQPATLAKGIAYYTAAQNESGTFPYDPSQRHELKGEMTKMAGGLEIARTPGAFFALLCAGAAPTSKEVRAAAKAMDGDPLAWSEGHGSATMALQFAALAARSRGEQAWADFRRIYFPRILDHQDESGACTCVALGKEFGVTVDTDPLGDLPGMDQWTQDQKVYVTAIHVLILLLDRSKPAALPPMPAPAGPTTGAPSGPPGNK